MKQYRIGVINYLNSAPLVYGLSQCRSLHGWDIITDSPSACYTHYENHAVDVALVPVGALSTEQRPYIIGDFCIGAQKYVDTVCLFSHRDVSSLRKIYLDPHSRTSVKLLRLLMCVHWQRHDVEYVALDTTSIGYDNLTEEIPHDAGVLLIGDKVFSQDGRWAHQYDLCNSWWHFTQGLPFVFAVWIKQHYVKDRVLVRNLNASLKQGCERVSHALTERPLPHGVTPDEALHYLQHRIIYHFDNNMRQGLTRFLTLCHQYNI